MQLAKKCVYVACKNEVNPKSKGQWKILKVNIGDKVMIKNMTLSEMRLFFNNQEHDKVNIRHRKLF